jgi:hypothetical protein
MIKIPDFIETQDFIYDDNCLKIIDSKIFIEHYFKNKIDYIDDKNIFYLFIKTLNFYYDVDIQSFISLKPDCEGENIKKFFTTIDIRSNVFIKNFITFLDLNKYSAESAIFYSIKEFLNYYDFKYDLLIDFDLISFICNRLYQKKHNVDIYNFILKNN